MKTSDILMTVLSIVVILALTACTKDGDTIKEKLEAFYKFFLKIAFLFPEICIFAEV